MRMHFVLLTLPYALLLTRASHAFRQFQYLTVPLCVSSDFRTRTLRRHLDAAVDAALASQEAMQA
jgi:hypothetical protein